MSLEFHHETAGQRVLFGAGEAASNLAFEVDRLGAKKVMVIASQRQLDRARKVAAEIEVEVWFDKVVMHVPLETAHRARQTAIDHHIGLMVSVGGGSAIGTAKAVAMTTDIPSIAVATTYAGSEATNVWGLTEKRTQDHRF